MNVPSRTLLTAILPMFLCGTPALAANVACGDVIDGTAVVLNGDVGPCPPALKVTVQNGGSLDLNGNRVSCDGGPFGVGVQVTDGGSVRNGIVSGCEFSGVQLGGTGGVVENVASRDNTGMGFAVYTSTASTLRYNTASNNDGDGFFVAASGSRLTSNSASNGGANGFAITGDSVQLTGNRAIENFSYGFHLSGNGCKLKTNQSIHNNSMGFYVTGSGNSLSGSIAELESYGYYISGNDNVLSKSSASSGYVGLYLNGDGNSISSNRFANATQGITQSFFADNNEIEKNVAWSHTSWDFGSETVVCGTNTWKGNKGGTRTDPCME